jgi:hypothetical protein
MQNTNTQLDPFTKPDAPSSNWEIVKWLFFEPTLLKRWVDKNEKNRWYNTERFLVIYLLYFLPFIVGIWILMVARMVVFNLPAHHPEVYRNKIDIQVWNSLLGFAQRWFFLANNLAFRFAFRLALGLALGLGVVLGRGLADGFGTVLGVVLMGVVDDGFDDGFDRILALIVSYYLFYFRVPFYPFYLIGLFKKINLPSNPYLYDEVIWLRMPWVEQALKNDAQQHPILAFRFVNFLLQYRKLQLKLAAELEHVATAAQWRSTLQLRSVQFDKGHILDQELPKAWAKMTPSSAWMQKVIELRATLRAAEATTAVVTQQSLYQKCLALVADFQAIHLRETFKGREEYFDTIRHWQQVLDNQLREVSKKVVDTNAISLNPYSKGNALSPEQAAGKSLFLERRDVKDELSLKIQTSAVMPTFLILGQRRVGKTSLLNFLPELLDPTLYDIVAVDAQSLSGETSLVNWLNYWRGRIEAKLKLPKTAPSTETDQLKAWDIFAAFLDNIVETRQRRLILAMDEYDEDRGFHLAIRQDAELGAAFLGRMRAFSQRQNWVVFLFVGATNFSDLPEPKWSRYFVQAHIVRVDYLSKSAALQLIESPVPNFGLQYEEGVAARIYELTQGHPHLLHGICSDLVDYANQKVKNPVGMEDLQYILDNKIIMKGEQPFSVFWDEFCETPSMRTAVKAIAFHEIVDPWLPDVRRLLDYGYIVEEGSGKFRMRAPLFEEWVKRYGY